MNKLFSRLSIKDQVFFAKRLSFLINANVPIMDSLHILQRQTKSKRQRQMYDTIITDVSNGQFLATSLGRFGHVFGDFAINIIKTGETSGSLDENLNYLAEELEKKQRLRRKVMGALIYPALIIVATLGITGLLTVYIFPKILPIFASLDVTLPITTRFLIWLSDFLSNWGLLVIGIIILVTVGLTVLISKKKQAHYVWDRIILRFPLLGKIALHYQVANITRTLGLLLKSGTSIVESLKITADTTSNMVFREKLELISGSVMEGELVSAQMLKYPHVFPDLMAQMVGIGEKTGKLSDTFLYLSDLYEEEVDNLTKNLSSTIEPVLMIFMGIIVGFIAVSIITPIYQVTQHLNP